MYQGTQTAVTWKKYFRHQIRNRFWGRSAETIKKQSNQLWKDIRGRLYQEYKQKTTRDHLRRVFKQELDAYIKQKQWR